MNTANQPPAPQPPDAIIAKIAAARAGDQAAFTSLTEPHRRELQVHCYRMLGSLEEAEDLVQETLLRAWRRIETFEGRASFRAWLYKIATNACLDDLKKRKRRSLPIQVHAHADPHRPFSPPTSEPVWMEPLPENWFSPAAVSPEARYSQQESVRLAFMVAVHTLPPRQRAILLLRDVLAWRAHEVADFLDISVAAVNSALQRARVSLAKQDRADKRQMVRTIPDNHDIRNLLDRYLAAWETADVPGLVSLLREDAAFTMPPSPSWYLGREDIATLLGAEILASKMRGLWKLIPTGANAQPAFALYQRRQESGPFSAFAIQVLTIHRQQLTEIATFLYPALFPRFGLDMEIEG